MSTIAFIGAGNMASAMIEGLIADHTPPQDLICLGGSGQTAATLAAKTGISLAPDLDTLLAQAPTVVVAFKPQHLAGSDPRLARLTAGKLVISVLAGKHLSRLAQVFPQARNVVRAMPNTPGQIGAGVTGWCSRQTLAAEDRTVVEKLLGALGRQFEIEETQMDALTALSGCGPAYLFEFAAALREGGIAAGLPRDLAQALTVETLLGSARLLARRQIEPEVLRNQVTSPNGVTFSGLKKMESLGFRNLVTETILAAKARSAEMAKDA
jgi:pyrroline-5-carboxylate reductase